VFSNHNRKYEATRLAGIQTLRRLRVIDEQSSGPLVVPSAIAAMQNTEVKAEDDRNQIASEPDVKLDGNEAEIDVKDEYAA
jgi:hypothetical protein